METKFKFIVCVCAAMLFVPSFLMAQKEVEAEMDSAAIEYLRAIDDVRFSDSVLCGMYGPTRRVYYQIEIPNQQDSTKTDTLSLTDEVQKLYGWGFSIGASAAVVADGMTYYDGSIGDHFSFQPELVFGIEGRQLGFGNTVLSNRVNCGIYGRIFMNKYSPKSSSRGKKYLSGGLETYFGYDIFGTETGIHVLSIGPTFGFEMQRMDTILDRSNGHFVYDQSWNVNFGLRVQYNAIIPKTGTSFSLIVGCRFAQVKALNQTDWTGQIYATVQISQLCKTRIAKKQFNERNKEIEDILSPKDKKEP